MCTRAAQSRGSQTVGPALVLGLCLGIAAGGGMAQSTFSPAERGRLARGELVVRRQAEVRGELRLMGGNAWQVVNAPPEAVWRAVLDTAYYTRLLPQVSEARNVADRDGSRLVYIRHGGGALQAGYHLRIDYGHAQRMAQFRLDRTRPHSIREAYGFFNIRSYEGGRTLINFGVMADVGVGFISGALRNEVQVWMLRVPQTIKRVVEGSARERYAVARSAHSG